MDSSRKYIEEKWNSRWIDLGLHKYKGNREKKFYLLEMFAYPSGDLHMGHLRNYVIGDVLCRYKLMKGFDVMHPVGWDAFGLPAEGAAIKRKVAPDEWTFGNIKVSSSTLKKMGLLYDWDREVVTCREDYYKWTQWLFIQMFKNNLAYRKKANVNWCPECQTVLANEQVENGECWRCHSVVEKKELEQWFFKITDYAQRLLDDIDTLKDWPENIKTMQRNWIGRSEGVVIDFAIENSNEKVSVFTTRPDTIFGVTFMALAPENPIIKTLKVNDSIRAEIEKYIHTSVNKTEIERQSTEKEKDGVYTGVNAINPLNNSKVKIFIADYVLASYGTGAVMGVPSHDTRDFAFSKKYGIDLVEVIHPKDREWDFSNGAFTEDGVMVNSGEFNGIDSTEAMKMISNKIESGKMGHKTIQFRLRDWLVSRQRYWGAPIPMIHCDECGIVPVPDEDLPVLLPPSNEVDFTPRGESPLSSHKNFMSVKCPKCGKDAKRDKDTMDTFVDSSWYQLRYTDARNDKRIFDKDKADALLPVDMYIGGAEHANGHLIYFRFITKVLNDLKLINANEPAKALFNQGMIMDLKGQIMSKSAGNAVPVGPFIDKYGCDIARGTELFIGPAGRDAVWSEDGITGITRFVERFERFCSSHIPRGAKDTLPATDTEKTIYIKLNKTIRQVERDIEEFSHNTAIAALMELLNLLYKHEKELDETFTQMTVERMLRITAPFMPHLCEELYEPCGKKKSIFLEAWPSFDKNFLEDENITLVIQINGKVRSRVEVPFNASEEEAFSAAMNEDAVKKYIGSSSVIKRIFVKGKLLNILIKQ
ncbi:MAG: leucine--tRNA ligase [bacterium]